MLATIQKLQQELENYKNRVNFLRQYIEHLTQYTVNSKGDKVYKSLADVDKAYRLQNELDFKNSLIEQRKAQIKQIEDQEKLKEKAIAEMPKLIEKSKLVIITMLDDLQKLKKSKKTKEIREAIKMIDMQIDEVSEIFDGICHRHENENYTQVLNDFRQINNILKLKE